MVPSIVLTTPEVEEREELGRLDEELLGVPNVPELGRPEELDRLDEEPDRLEEELGLPVVRGDILDDPELPKPVLLPPKLVPPPPLPDRR